MATKLSDVLEQESSGIMFPFRTGVKPVKTEQQVYTPTDGIMNVKGMAYEGPDATITYGSEEQGFPRQLKEIEKGMLPQFDQTKFPDMGTGKIETTATPTTQPIEPDKPIMDPCPAGFKLINGVCQPIEQQTQQDRGGGGQTFTGPKISSTGKIDGYTHVLDRAAGSGGTLNSMKMQQIEDEYGLGIAKKVGEVNQKYRNRGVQLKAITNAEKNRILNVYGEDRLNKDYVEGNDGVYYRVVATSPTVSELITDAAIATGQIIDAAAEQGGGFIGAAKAVADDLNDYLTGESEKSDAEPVEEGTTQTDTKKDIKTDTPTLTAKDLGGIDKISDTVKTFSKDFGTLENDIIKELDYQKTMSNELQKLLKKKFPPQLAKSEQIKKLQESQIKSVQDLISESKTRQNIAEDKSKRQNEAVQNELNNSKESSLNVKGSKFTVHTNSKGKIVGYSKVGSNNVNMAGMPPIGPGVRIKTKSNRFTNRFTKRAAPTKTKLTGGKLKGTMGYTRGK
jgi:hypothetical protein